MAKWKYTISVYNGLDRTLKVVEQQVAWGKKGGFPTEIAPNTSGTFEVYSPAARSSGIEFYLVLRDQGESATELSYGTVGIKVDIPYWKTKNTSSCKTTGILQVTGFEEIPDGAHDFTTNIMVSRK